PAAARNFPRPGAPVSGRLRRQLRDAVPRRHPGRPVRCQKDPRMNRLRLHPVATVIAVLLLVLAGLVTFKLTSSGAKSDPRKGRLITVGTVVPVRQDLD